MQPGTVWAPLSGVPLLLLVVACASDARNRRIPNVLVLITAVTGILFAVIAKSWASGLWQAGAGLGTGLLIWLPLYALGVLGAGDVKLFAAAATFLGPHGAMEGALYTALYGGVLAGAFMIVDSGWTLTAIRVAHAVQQPALLRNETASKRRRMPYAIAIAAGVLTALWLPGYLIP